MVKYLPWSDPGSHRDGRIPDLIELCQRVSSEIKKTATMGLGHSGPWNIAAHLRGTESLLMDTYDDPVFVHELMKFSTEVVRSMGDALIEAGFSPSLGEAAASCSLISPEIYRNFIKPYHQLPASGVPKQAPMPAVSKSRRSSSFSLNHEQNRPPNRRRGLCKGSHKQPSIAG